MSDKEELKSKFNGIYSEHLKDLIVADSKLKNVKGAIRFIEHGGSPVPNDFLPTVIKDGDPFPTHEQQERKTKPNSFGISFFDTVEHLVEKMNLVPSTRDPNCQLVSVDLKVDYGTCSDYDANGHMNHYLFNPYQTTPYSTKYKSIPFTTEESDDEKNS